MEAVRDFLPFQDTDQASSRSADSGVDDALTLLRGVSSTAAAEAAAWKFRAAADFAGRVEELSRTMEYLQLVAAAAVDRTRKQSVADAARAARVAGTSGWTTGWRDTSSAGSVADMTHASGDGEAGNASDDSADINAVDDGYRNTTEFLRARLRISAAEARRRLALGEDLLPRTRLGSRELLPPAREELGAAVASAEVASRTAGIITAALDRVRHICDTETAARMEHALTRTAAENDPDFLVRVARSWTDAIDQDGAEPTEELLRQLQGAFIRSPRHGLHHLEIFATAEQFEHLLTVMNTATNPRTTTADLATTHATTDATADSQAVGGLAAAAAGGAATDGTAVCTGTASVFAADAAASGVFAAANTAAPAGVDAGPGTDPPGFPEADRPAVLDLRTRPQKLLDGLIGACKAALATGTLPAAGGLRPQVMVTIDYRDLLARLQGTVDGDVARRSTATGRSAEGTGTLLFTGPVTASTARKIACDADILPVLLGSEGRILDIGRTTRIFPPHIRKALTARDQGCAFPGCTIPAPWCEAHHITYWSRGGTTGTDNGTLLCSHHHHLIHKEQWTIELHTGIPWFIPPPHLDPRQKPRRNNYFHPDSHPLTT